MNISIEIYYRFKAAVFRRNAGPYDSMLADVVLTFTDWTDDFRVDLKNPSILGFYNGPHNYNITQIIRLSKLSLLHRSSTA